MRMIKLALLGAAVAYGINYITKKRADGSSILDDFTENAPDWFQKGKTYAEKTFSELKDNIKQQAKAAGAEL